MGHDHAHNHGAGALRSSARHQKRLAISFGLIGAFFVVEAVGGVLTNSLALLDQARHILQAHYHVSHATLQVEPTDHVGCDEVHW